MYSLIRFFKEKEYVKKFLDGDIFMHSIGHFRKIEENPEKFLKMKIGIEPENDYYEGVYEILSVDEIKAKYKFDLRALFGDHIIAPVVNIIDAYKYVHLLCMSLLPYDNECEEVERIDMQDVMASVANNTSIDAVDWIQQEVIIELKEALHENNT